MHCSIELYVFIKSPMLSKQNVGVAFDPLFREPRLFSRFSSSSSNQLFISRYMNDNEMIGAPLGSVSLSFETLIFQ